MAEELLVVLSRSENSGFGFSLLGKPGLPPIIFNIIDDSPAAESGEVEIGDVILKVNETDVNTFSTKEVLKCLRLSTDPVTLKIKRDPKIKATVRQQQLHSTDGDLAGVHRTTSTPPVVSGLPAYQQHPLQPQQAQNRPEPLIHKTNGTDKSGDQLQHNNKTTTTNGNKVHHRNARHLQQHHQDELQWEPLGGEKPPKAKYEAYMMTGEHILNISKTQPQPIIVPKQLFKDNRMKYQNSHSNHQRQNVTNQPQHNSVPNSPNEMEMGHRSNHHHHHNATNSATTSPVSANKRTHDALSTPSPSEGGGTAAGKQFNNFVRTSRSEDQLQDAKSISTVDIDVDDDITSSLNTLLDTRPDASYGSVGSGIGTAPASQADRDRIVWTYNAPVDGQQLPIVPVGNVGKGQLCHTISNGSSSSPTSSSPMRSDSPQSPTSVSSSVMSSHSGSRRAPPYALPNGPHSDAAAYGAPTNGDFSVSEAISNISSPDYNDDDSMGIRDCVMEISDHSDSDSTLLVSEPRQPHKTAAGGCNQGDSEHRIVIQVKGPDKDTVKDRGKGQCANNRREQISAEYEFEDEAEERALLEGGGGGISAMSASSSPPVSEDDSDVDSLHSFHYSPKAVDMPSAIRLANRLYNLDGFKKSDVSRHLSKNNEFSRAVADEYLRNFNFDQDTLDIALRKFLKQFSLTGETQERERVLVHFSKRFLDCNPGSFNSQDAVHTLTCAIMLLNTDLHTQNINRKMTCHEFIENLAGLNENENFPREVLKQLYHAIKNNPLEWAVDDEVDHDGQNMQKPIMEQHLGGNPFLDVPSLANATEYKKGYVMRKCCYESNAKRTPFHKRSWKMFYCTLRDMVLYLHKDENGFRKNQMGDNLHNAIRIYHALATKATDYTKKQYVFRLQTADQAEYLFQTSDSKELQSWIDTINFVCASFSAPPLEAAVGSQKKFQRPLLPCSHTKLNFREQLRDHEERVMRLESELEEHRRSPPERNAKSLVVQNYKEREVYLNFEVKRYRAYAYILRSKMSAYPELGVSLVESCIGELDEATGCHPGDAPATAMPPVQAEPAAARNSRSPQTNRLIVHIKYVPKYESPIPRRKLD
ncbi:PH and SEC7 domain-containing protein isoform X2 [Atheta coriaria]|uniref:PH and SEC7 domain-containing protein isoform X2 n=1 Tax=Dalotia coriaria TaxID=877792 RepID=UPI0031F3C067